MSDTLTVAKPSPGHRELVFQGQRLPVGTQINMRDYPKVSAIPGKWDLMIDAGYFDDDRLADLDPTRRARRERLRSAAAESKAEPVVPIDRFLDAEDVARLEKPLSLQCGDCGFQATSVHGLRVHQGRSHKKE
jgi:hypothetical protein